MRRFTLLLAVLMALEKPYQVAEADGHAAAHFAHLQREAEECSEFEVDSGLPASMLLERSATVRRLKARYCGRGDDEATCFQQIRDHCSEVSAGLLAAEIEAMHAAMHSDHLFQRADEPRTTRSPGRGGSSQTPPMENTPALFSAPLKNKESPREETIWEREKCEKKERAELRAQCDRGLWSAECNRLTPRSSEWEKLHPRTGHEVEDRKARERYREVVP